MTIPPFLLIDLDDTILDYDATGMACWSHYYRMYAPRMGVTIPDLQQAVEASRKWYWDDMRRYRHGRLHQWGARRAILHRAFRALGLRQPDLAEEFADTFTREREEWIKPFPGAVEALEKIRASGARTALVTNGQASQQRAKVERFNLAGYFDLLWIEGERGVGKPDARVFTQVAKELGARVEDAWMIGDDMRFDICPAHQLGMHTVWIDIGRDSDEDIPYEIRVPSLSQLCTMWLMNSPQPAGIR
jgi:putative hydrolase of the HAD superfamily